MRVLMDLPIPERHSGFSVGLFGTGSSPPEESEMRDEDKTKEQLITELHELREQLAESEKDKAKLKRAEVALQDAHSLLLATLESTADGILVIDTTGKVAIFSRSFLELWRIPEILIATRDDKQLIQFVLDQLLYPDAFLNKVRALYQTPDASSVDELVFKDGRIFERYSQPQRIDETIVGRVWSFRDITAHRRAEESLRRTEENFRRSLEESPLGVRIVTEEGETIYANRAILNIYGYDSIEDLKTTPAKKRYTPESYAEFQIRREKRKQGSYVPSEYEISIIREDGEVRHLQVVRKEVLWDGERQFQVIYQDITERKQAEEVLWESKEKYRAVADFTYDWEYWLGLDGRYIYVSPSCERITGYRAEEFLREPALLERIVHPDDQALIVGHLEQVRVQGGDHNIDFRIITRSGEERWIGHCCQAVYGREGQYLGQRGSNRDITERKRAEEEFQESEQRVQWLNEHLLNMVMVLSHDIRGPLVGIASILKLLLRGAYGKLDQSPANTVQDLLSRCVRLLGTAEDYLGQASIAVGSMTMDREVLDLRQEIIDAVLDELADDITRHEIVIDNRLGAIPAGSISISANKTWLKAVYRNLFTNAIKYGGKGCTISFGFEQHESHYRLNVYNSGRPIAEEDRETVFAKFGRVEPSEGTTPDGVGLGLCLCREIIRDHGGEIWYEARPDGSNFVFTISREYTGEA
jgi:PAS domain S-box-containing protein